MSLLSIDEAFKKIEDSVSSLTVCEMPLAAAQHRVTAAQIPAQCDLPPFDQSAMDGYALRASDVRQLPTRLPLSRTVAAGAHEQLPILPLGHACRIYTGGMIPVGADTVVRQEWTQRDGDSVLIERETPPSQDLRRKGEELARGSVLIEAGRRLNSGHLAMLAMAGVAQVSVRRAPKIRVLVSGDEVVDAGKSLRPGEVYNANGPLISAWLAQAGYANFDVEAVADDEAKVSEALARGFAQADLVLSTGGVSVGDRDLIAPEAEKLRAERILWKVAQKPGKPIYVARHENSLLMGLPGNPGSVLVNLAVFVRRALDCMEGLHEHGPDFRSGRLAKLVRADPDRETWLRVRVQINDQGQVELEPQSAQASHMLSNLAHADAIARIPIGDAPLEAGSIVSWLSLGL